ncbi:hypothetical protein AC579_6547 [Pseudocercospora musae]|uniref:Uncharacterized protein n=1 Tax=Pseudocercospora musae TaxID=113226 RepID=A0A139IL89_9PEZI|nr:hypothetical protein AC579_6547 [Pseudocercospora musae]
MQAREGSEKEQGIWVVGRERILPRANKHYSVGATLQWSRARPYYAVLSVLEKNFPYALVLRPGVCKVTTRRSRLIAALTLSEPQEARRLDKVCADLVDSSHCNTEPLRGAVRLTPASCSRRGEIARRQMFNRANSDSMLIAYSVRTRASALERLEENVEAGKSRSPQSVPSREKSNYAIQTCKWHCSKCVGLSRLCPAVKCSALVVRPSLAWSRISAEFEENSRPNCRTSLMKRDVFAETHRNCAFPAQGEGKYAARSVRQTSRGPEVNGSSSSIDIAQHHARTTSGCLAVMILVIQGPSLSLKQHEVAGCRLLLCHRGVWYLLEAFVMALACQQERLIKTGRHAHDIQTSATAAFRIGSHICGATANAGSLIRSLMIRDANNR